MRPYPPLYGQVDPPQTYSSPTLWHEHPRFMSSSMAFNARSRGQVDPPQILKRIC